MSDPSTNIDDLLNQLTAVQSALTPTELIATHGAGLKTPGLYSWWVDESGANELTSGLGISVVPGLIYAGQAGATQPGSRSTSTSTLWSRLKRNHLGGNHRSSTLRRTLGSILASSRQWPEIDESELTSWMFEHLRVIPVAVVDSETLDALETAVVARLDPPGNLRKVPATLLRRRLTQLRGIYGHRR